MENEKFTEGIKGNWLAVRNRSPGGAPVGWALILVPVLAGIFLSQGGPFGILGSKDVEADAIYGKSVIGHARSILITWITSKEVRENLL